MYALGGDYMFIGTFNHTFDSKGRVIIPAKLREELGETFYIGRGLDTCINVYPISAWNELVAKLNKLSSFGKRERQFRRKILSSYSESNFDKQGRILIPSVLREYCDLKDEVIIFGAGKYIEIWEKSVWIDFDNSSDADVSDMAEELFKEMDKIDIE